jgi:predicted negative regulator of RcsB-dependent stress response
VTSAHFSAELQELKGDLYLAGNESVKARAAYQAALETGNGSALLQMKLDNLPTPAAPKE